MYYVMMTGMMICKKDRAHRAEVLAKSGDESTWGKIPLDNSVASRSFFQPVHQALDRMKKNWMTLRQKPTETTTLQVVQGHPPDHDSLQGLLPRQHGMRH